MRVNEFKSIGKLIGVTGLVLFVAACTRMGTVEPVRPVTPMPTTISELPALPASEMQAPSTPIQQASLPAGNYAFIDSSALGSLNDAARAAARDAQFYALQFGRPGAPRNWSSGGASGQVSVGPYVRVNNLDCREFTHRTTVNGQNYSRSGTACREANGTWDIVQA